MLPFVRLFRVLSRSPRGLQRSAGPSFLASLVILGALTSTLFAANDLPLPRADDRHLRVLSPTMLELSVVTQPTAPEQPFAEIVDEHFTLQLPAPETFIVTANDTRIATRAVGFKRRVLHAPLHQPDIRLGNWLYLELAAPLPPDATVTVTLRNEAPPQPPQSARHAEPERGGDGAPPALAAPQTRHPTEAPSSSRAFSTQRGAPTDPAGSVPLWPADWRLTARADPARESPAIHVSFAGYDRDLPKFARVGYYLGSLGELPIPAHQFALLDARDGRVIHRGRLTRQPERGSGESPPPYQEVFVADFSAFRTPGVYRLAVDGLGVSPPFRIHDAAAIAVARTYALGLYHQRCGAPNALPFTRHTHDACHLAPAAVPSSAAAFPFTWKLIGELAAETRDDASHPSHPFTADATSALFPFVRTGPVDVSGGHHDAGDYSKYTTNSAALVHTLIFAVDALPGLAALDHLGLPESGDGIPDLLQTAKWEADFLAKLQDDDGGFYFLVYPRDRRYESNVLPDAGDPQVVWPKNTAATAAAVAALAQCAASPQFKKHYPAEAARYLAQARRGWEFLRTALAECPLVARWPNEARSAGGPAADAEPATQHRATPLCAYQRLTHYGDNFAHDDEIAWAACELFLATGEAHFHERLHAMMPDPARLALRRWGWWRLSESWGNATRSYAFAVRTGRRSLEQLDRVYLDLCTREILAAADDAFARTAASAYGTAFPLETKRLRHGGWYFSLDSAFDLAVGHVLEPRASYLDALVANLGFEVGVNPLNRVFLTGLGPARQHELVHQFSQNDRRALPPSGLPIGNITAGQPYHAASGVALRRLSFPDDAAASAAYALYDRWSDVHNVSSEFVVTNQARGLATAAYLSALAGSPNSPWRAVEARIVLTPEHPQLGTAVTAQLELLAPHAAGKSNLSAQLEQGTTPSRDARRAAPDAAALVLADADLIWEARDHAPQRGAEFVFTPRAGRNWIEAEAVWSDGRRAFAVKEFQLTAPETTWIDDAIPVGARDHAGAPAWLASEPRPRAGSKAHTAPATLTSGSPGLHEHGFDHADEPLEVGADDVLFADVWLDPAAPPRAIMLAWNDGSWEHRAFWGADAIPYGAAGTAGRWRAGELPEVGRWVRVEVSARAVGLAGREVRGMSFSAVDGRAVWDRSGVTHSRR